MSDLKANVERLEKEKVELEEQLAASQKENEYLIKNAADEIQKITDFIEMYQNKQKRKYEVLKQAFESKESVNR